jgi:hypothetical protein
MVLYTYWNIAYMTTTITELRTILQRESQTHNYINRQNQSTTGKLWKRNDPDLVQAFLKKWWVESDFKAFHIVKMYKDKEVKKNVKDIFLSMCDVKIFLTFTSPNMVLLWQLFYLFCSCIEIRIIATGPCIANQLRDVNTICRRSWYIAAHVWKIYDFKIDIANSEDI